MREGEFWRRVARGMAGRWSACRHEDTTRSGVPDVSFGLGGRQGWVELKVLPRWPRPETPVKMAHFTQLQRVWLVERGRAGGRCFLLLGVERDALLLPWRAIELRDERTLGELAAVGLLWRSHIDWTKLAESLRTDLGAEPTRR